MAATELIDCGSRPPARTRSSMIGLAPFAFVCSSAMNLSSAAWSRPFRSDPLRRVAVLPGVREQACQRRGDPDRDRHPPWDLACQGQGSAFHSSTSDTGRELTAAPRTMVDAPRAAGGQRAQVAALLSRLALLDQPSVLGEARTCPACTARPPSGQRGRDPNSTANATTLAIRANSHTNNSSTVCHHFGGACATRSKMKLYARRRRAARPWPAFAPSRA